MKILVIGGNGLTGTKVASNLRQLGYDFVAGAPRTRINTDGAQLNDQSLTPTRKARFGATTFSAWFSKSRNAA